jgi:peroxiredoxin
MKTKPRFWTISLLALSLGALTAHSVAGATIRAVLQVPSTRKAAPPFSLLDASGKTVRVSDYQGKVVVLNFWATDCGGCRIEIPWFVDLDQAFKNSSAAVIGISLDVSYESLKNAEEGWSKVKPFVQTHGINYPILMADDGILKHYSLDALPATYLIDKKGRIAATYVGLINEDDVKANVKALLTE